MPIVIVTNCSFYSGEIVMKLNEPQKV